MPSLQSKPEQPILRRDVPALLAAARPLEELLASGGDGRLALNAQDQRNSYGCTPFPRPALLDFGSSTASSISPMAHARAQAAQAQMWLNGMLHNHASSFDDCVEAARHSLCRHLGAEGAEVVFSPSGTDAQLQVLFLIKVLLGGPLATIIVGADQTGSGTAHTARGCHFSDRTSLGTGVEKGAPIPGLSEQVRTIAIPFCDETGHVRSDAQMDAAVKQAVTDAISRGEKVLLQVMDSSKLGWRAPSTRCTDTIAAAWPNQVRVVVDACQMRLGRPQLKDYLDRGYFVLLTGSKFFTGPAFSGALLVPASQADAIEHVTPVPLGLGSYSTCHDWPRRWHALREALPARTNHGQWLRWEASLAEMDAYFAVPLALRHGVLKQLAARVPRMIRASKNLQLLAEQRGASDPRLSAEMRHRTIFSFVPHRGGEALTLEQCTSVYRAMGRDVSGLLALDTPATLRRTLARTCQIGQPVLLRYRSGAALRLCASARIVSDCWARAASVSEALGPVLEDVRVVISKLDWLIDHPELCESSTP